MHCRSIAVVLLSLVAACTSTSEVPDAGENADVAVIPSSDAAEPARSDANLAPGQDANPAGDPDATATEPDATQTGDPDATQTGDPDATQTGDPDATTSPADAGLGLPSTTASQVAVGRLHTCAITAAGGVRCWGYSNRGQLGNSAPEAEVSFHEPVAVSGLTGGVTAISAGSDHNCAVASGAAWCWGLGDRGQLGNASTNNSSAPVPVSGLTSGVTAIATGDSHSCAVVGGGVKCWGLNDYGQLGNDTTDDSSIPVDVVGLGSGVARISAGRYHTCAVTTAGAARCWGGNVYGELGDGSNNSSHVPLTPTTLGSGVASIAAGDSVTCVVTSNGGARCWGKNGHGQVGNGTGGTLEEIHAPVDVSGLTSGTTLISVGWEFTCAIASGGARCWGNNFGGALGNNQPDSFESHVPVQVSGLGSGAAFISASVSHACAVVSGAVKCWGDNGAGELGDGTDTSAYVPVSVVSLP